MALVNINWSPTVKELRSFSLLWTPLFLLAFAGLVWWRDANTNLALILVGIVAVVAALGLVAPKAIKPLFVLLMVVTFPIGFVVSHVLLAALFYLVFTPIGLIVRLVGRDPMARAIDKKASTYFIKRAPAPAPDRYFRQF